jgi:N,N'-diacetyllegionaminate synthase
MITPLEIIAEAGSNHNGDPDRAGELIDLAVEAGASSIKFQFIFAEGLYLPQFFDGVRYVPNPVFDQRRGEEMSEADWEKIWEYAQRKGIAVSASVFCNRGIELLKRLGSPYVKIASTDLTNHTLIGRACAAFNRVIVSTGMANLAEIDAMVQFVRTHYPQTELCLMHCVSAYPCPLEDANTQRVALLHHCFDLPVGYSDHTYEALSAPMALVHGATFFEKHFTTDRSLPGFDHAYALDGPEFASYVQHLNAAAKSLARPANSLSDQEKITKVRARRGVYAARDLSAGYVLQQEDLLFVRPSTSFDKTDLTGLIGQPLAQETPHFSALDCTGAVQMVTSNWQEAHAYWGQEMKEKRMHPKDGQTEKNQ